MRPTLWLATAPLCLLAACAGTGDTFEPVVDGSRGAQYQSDLAACQALSRQKRLDNGETRTAALVGAGLIGLAAAADDENDGDRLEAGVLGALIGGAMGAGAGAAEAYGSRQDIISNCMSGRGHRVVG